MNIDDLYIPEDVDEDIREDIVDVLKTIADGWGRWLTLDKGWYKLVIDTHKKLKYIDANYQIHQIKEKFGGLRYYYQSSFPYRSMQNEIMQAIVNNAEQAAERTCEICGTCHYKAKVETKVRNYWFKTLCRDCATEQGYEIEDDEDIV